MIDIIIEPNLSTTRIYDIKYGKCFFFENFIYMRIRLHCSGLEAIKSEKMVTCCNMKSGTIRLLSQNTRVVRVDAKLYVPEKK